ncbi:hypothetical protein [uncultured Bradyrhizobium sp.]|jgi:hypothetical protein|uniref:hypothetical protein n=1 Tax=uncultured Bradyrhizobium sp. TaxID=199684 RepID=UPI00262A05CD|nr:hypothetical protein [uncultured Bradyrhizobium sp.]
MSDARGASKALRGASNRLGRRLGQAVKHTRSPRADFDQLLKDVRDPRKLAESYYLMGLKRGLNKATDYILDGTFNFDKQGDLRSPKKLKVDVRLGLPGQSVKPRSFKINADDFGFDD